MMNRMSGWRAGLGVILVSCMAAVSTATAAECSDAPVKVLNAGLLSAMSQGSASTFASRKAELTPVLSEAFDLPVVARLVLGKAFADLDTERRAAFTEAFSDMVYATYASRFKRANGVAFNIRETRPTRRARCVVRATIERPEKDPVRLDYLVHQRDGAWRIINVVAQGVSDLALKRAEYGAVIQREGFDALLHKLRAQTQRLGTG